jgi:hypothetical protein
MEIETGDRAQGVQHLRAVVAERADHPVARAYLDDSGTHRRQAS